jgi:hypothetical protein
MARFLGKSRNKCLSEINRNLSRGKMMRAGIIFLSKMKQTLARERMPPMACALLNA